MNMSSIGAVHERHVRGARGIACALLISLVGCARGTVARGAFEQTYLVAEHNWAFRSHFPQADRLLYAFDYGHAILYQTLLTRPDAAARLEGPEFTFITQRLLRHPPTVPLDEATVGPEYVQLIPEVVQMFGWAHMLHRQLYDVWAAWGLTDMQRDSAAARVIAYYRSRRDLAFSARPKSMALMEGQPYSLAFRRQDPKFNGLLWSYHWFQLALYDALITGRTEHQLQAGVDSVTARFFAMLDDAPACALQLAVSWQGQAAIAAAEVPTGGVAHATLDLIDPAQGDQLTLSEDTGSGAPAVAIHDDDIVDNPY